MALKSIFELGVDEAYAILSDQLGIESRPPLEAIENEDWGRDLLLDHFTRFPEADLGRVGLTLSSDNDAGDGGSPG